MTTGRINQVTRQTGNGEPRRERRTTRPSYEGYNCLAASGPPVNQRLSQSDVRKRAHRGVHDEQSLGERSPTQAQHSGDGSSPRKAPFGARLPTTPRCPVPRSSSTKDASASSTAREFSDSRAAHKRNHLSRRQSPTSLTC